MALEKIKGERTIRALKLGAGRLNDGGCLYLVPYAWGESHYWRMDYTHQGRRRTLSLGYLFTPLRFTKQQSDPPPA